MLVTYDQILRGYTAVADTVGSKTKVMVQELKDMSLRTAVITGNNHSITRAIANRVGTDCVIANVLPGDKAKHVARFQDRNENAVMVDNGINGAPTLVQVDIGITMGAGTEVAIETADITILGGGIALVPKAIHAGHKTIRSIKRNLLWAFGYNAVGIPITAVGLLTPRITGATMALSSIGIVTDALRLKRMKS